MKHSNRPLTLILTAALLTASLLQTAGCGYKDPEDPFDPIMTMPFLEGSDPEDGGLSLGRYFGESDYDPNAEHGEKKLYRNEETTNTRTLYNDMVIERRDPNIVTYGLDTPLDARALCFDPTCEHGHKETCTAYLHTYGEMKDPNDITSETVMYETQMVIDAYDYADVPVIYMAFRRPGIYYVNDVMHERESVYCIERFDMKTGKRTIVADNIQENIDELGSYGDYVYFTTIDATGQYSLSRVHKKGGEIETLEESDHATTYSFIDVADGKLYYLADLRYLRRCDLALTESEQIVDMAELSGIEGGARTLICGASGGYLYYRADVEPVYGVYEEGEEPVELGDRCNMYRLPIDNLTAEPELVVKGMEAYEYEFTDDTLFYLPAVFEIVDVPSGLDHNMDSVNTCDGKVLALDLNTLEVTTVCEDTGLVIFLKKAINCDDDRIILVGRPYTEQNVELANDGHNELIGKKSGGGLEMWIEEKPVEYRDPSEFK